MSALPPCPKCQSELTYEDGAMFICPECAHEWSKDAAADAGEDKRVVRDSNGTELHEWSKDAAADAGEDKRVVRDSNGTELHDGDTVTVIKDLKVKGTSSVVKVGTKVKSIRLVDGDHDIDCKIDGIGQMGLKSEFVKKV